MTADLRLGSVFFRFASKALRAGAARLCARRGRGENAQLPAVIVNQANAAIVKALGVPGVRVRLEAVALAIRGSTPKQFADGLAKSYATYHKIVTVARSRGASCNYAELNSY